MAVQTPIAVRFDDVFPAGAYVLAVEAAQDFDKIRAGVADSQVRDKDSGERVWTVRVLDADPEARTSEVKVKVVAPVQPVPPDTTGGTPFRPVEFDGLTLTPYVKEAAGGGRPRVAYSLRASVMRAPAAGKPPSSSAAGGSSAASSGSSSTSSSGASGSSSKSAA